MNMKPSRLVTTMLVLLGTPMAAFADGVVPPPVMPGTTLQAAPVVAPPEQVNSLQPTLAAGTGELIDIALPSAPPAPDLRPTLPGAKKKTEATSRAPERAEATPAVDPFAGILATPVSDSQLNRFVFPEPIEGIYFAEGAPLPECPEGAGAQDPCKPVFLNGRKMMLLQLRAGAKGPVQMLVHLHSGRVVTMNLMPTAGPGAVVRVDGAEDGASDQRLAKTAAQSTAAADPVRASEQYVELLSRIARGDIPAGFEPIAAGLPVRFEYFDVVPMASWDNGAGLRAHLMQVVAHGDAPVAINAALFRTEHIEALALDRETITDREPAMLYLLESMPEGAR